MLLAPIASVVGMLFASIFYHINILTASIIVIGLLSGQIAVNVLDDYIDYKRGIDTSTTQTKFSGGSKYMVKKQITPKGTLALGMLLLSIALIIGIYIIINHPIVLPFVLVGLLSILFYAKYLINIPFFAEPLVAINYALVTIGSFAAMANSLVYGIGAALCGISIGVIVTTLLVVNEVPDRQADRKHGRKSGVVILWHNKKIARFYMFWIALPYIAILIGVLAGFLPAVILSAFILIPFAMIVQDAIKVYKSPKSFEKYMGFNVIHGFAFIIVVLLAVITAVI